MSDRPEPKAAYADLDWARIREEYETTDVSARELSRRWGMRSENTLRRRIVAEGWVRDQNAITAGLVTAAVARTLTRADDLSSATTAAAPVMGGAGFGAFMQPKDFAESLGHLTAQSEAERRAHDDAHTAAHIAKQPKSREKRVAELLASPPAHKPAPPPAADEPQKIVVFPAPSSREVADAADLTTSRKLADIHAEAIAAQVRIADRVTAVGLKLLEAVSDALSENDEVRQNAVTVLMLNDESDGLAKSVEAASRLIEKGIGHKRKALGMDVVQGRPSTPGGILNGDPEGARPEREVRKILEGLSVEALLAFRPAVVEITKLRPVIDVPYEGVL